jgi:poly-gamma-glutamate synthesis protein (capsule biosynthesis protein)
MTDIRILAVGDFCPVGTLRGVVDGGKASAEKIAEEIRIAAGPIDGFVVNLECPLTETKTRSRKAGWHLQARGKSAEFLAALGVDLITLANNHVLDAGEEGLRDTLEACATAGIQTVGAGLSAAEAGRVAYLNRRGRVLAVVNMAERDFSCADASRGGANAFDVVRAVASIREARKRAQHVLLVVHGGLEGVHVPSPESVRVLRFLAEEGCTAILRHHPHAVQGYEVWNTVPIFYSVGNFLFDWHSPLKNDAWYEGLAVRLSFSERDECSFELLPFEQCKVGPGLSMLTGAGKSAFLQRLADWSTTVSEPEALREAWRQVIEERRVAYRASLVVTQPLATRVLRRMGLLRLVSPSRRRLTLLENYLRCDTHRELLLDILERTPAK